MKLRKYEFNLLVKKTWSFVWHTNKDTDLILSPKPQTLYGVPPPGSPGSYPQPCGHSRLFSNFFKKNRKFFNFEAPELHQFWFLDAHVLHGQITLLEPSTKPKKSKIGRKKFLGKNSPWPPLDTQKTDKKPTKTPRETHKTWTKPYGGPLHKFY